MPGKRLPTLDEPLDLGPSKGLQPSEVTKDEPLAFGSSTASKVMDVPVEPPVPTTSGDIAIDVTASDLDVVPGRPIAPPKAAVAARAVASGAPQSVAGRGSESESFPPALRFSERPRTEDLMVGTMLDGRYEILEVIGRGAMGVVYRARQASADREVAVKVLIPEVSRKEKSLARFANEAKIISRLRHPNTLRLFDCRTDRGGLMYIVTELLRGIPLGRLIARKGALPVDRAMHIADEVASSLAEAHGVGIIHRDIKPDNVFLERLGDEDVVKVLDFGIAKLLDDKSALTTLGTLVGTPAYVSPEQAMGRDLDARSDLYALGVLLHHMLSGVPPFKAGSAADTIAMHLHAPVPPIVRPPLLEPVPPALEALVRDLLAKSPAARPKAASEVRERLKLVREGQSIERAPLPRVISTPPSPARTPSSNGATAPNATVPNAPQPQTEGVEKDRRIFGRLSSAVTRFVSKPGGSGGDSR